MATIGSWLTQHQDDLARFQHWLPISSAYNGQSSPLAPSGALRRV